MSSIEVKVSSIESCESLHIVSFEFYGEKLTMMSLELGENIKVGQRVRLIMKPSHIGVAKNFTSELSYENQLRVTLISYENGALLSSLKLAYHDTVLESIITSASMQRMNLYVGEELMALIQASELSIAEVLDDRI